MEPDKIKPEHNPWYLLATLHGEAEYPHDEVHARNRRTWNRFMAAELTEAARELLVKEERCSAEELEPFTSEELSEVENVFAERHRQATGKAGTAGDAPSFPDVNRDEIDFSNVDFERPLLVVGFMFPVRRNSSFGWIIFSGATFSNRAEFSRATFFVEARFRGARFGGQAIFEDVRFYDLADFSGVTFSAPTFFRDATFFGSANFSDAIFDWTNFSRATFFDQANLSKACFSALVFFQNSVFARVANFSGAKFLEDADLAGTSFQGETVFVNAEMRGPTSFENARFCSAPPQFFGATLHEGTVWRGVPPWPLPPDQKAAGPFVDAYERLKLEMDRLKKHEDELDFFALELQSRRVLHGDWQPVPKLKILGRTISLPSLEIPEKTITPRPRKLFGRSFALPSFTIKARTIGLFRPAPGLTIALYGWLSDYGRSYVRPLYGLLGTVVAGVLPFWWHLCKFWQAAGHSLANTLGVFGFRRELIGSDVLAALPGRLKVVAAAQTVAGIVLLFLLGLAIRNRFRMK